MRTTDDKINQFVCEHDTPVCSTCAPSVIKCPLCDETRVKLITTKKEPNPNPIGDQIDAQEAYFDGKSKAYSSKVKTCLKIAAVIVSIAALVLALLILL